MADLTQDPASTATPDAVAEGYRPLSLLALVGFLLSLIFAGSVVVGGVAAFAARYPGWLIVAIVASLVAGWLTALSLKRNVIGTIALALGGLATLVGLGGLVAFSGTSPWLLPWPIWLLVAIALLTCWLARARITASEGTLGGSTLAAWGIGLTLFFTLNYAAYSLSSTYAVRSQGREATDQFIELLKNGQVLEAFVRTIPARSRPSGADLRRTVEVEANAPKGTTGGAYTTFTNHTLVRLIQMFGQEATYEKIAVYEEADQKGFRVKVTYRGTTSFGPTEFDLNAFGQESSDGTAVRRQWNIEMTSIGFESVKDIVVTDEGKALFSTIDVTKPLANLWLQNLGNRRIGEAYLSTVAPEDRQAQAVSQILRHNAVFTLTGLSLGGGLKASPDSLKKSDLGLQRFMKGSCLDVNDLYPPPNRGAANEALRQEIISRVQKVLSGEAVEGTRVELGGVDLPMYRRTDENRISISYPIKILTREGGKGRLIEGDLEIVGPWSKEALPPMQYQVRQLRLYRGPEAIDHPSQGPR